MRDEGGGGAVTRMGVRKGGLRERAGLLRALSHTAAWQQPSLPHAALPRCGGRRARGVSQVKFWGTHWTREEGTSRRGVRSVPL